MRAGTLRHRVIIEKAVTEQDLFGQPLESWQTVATVWAAINDNGGGERYVAQAEQRVADRRTKITIRERSDVSVTMRLRHGANIYNIERIERDPTLAWQMVLWCGEVNP